MRAPDLVIDGGNGPQTLRWHLFKWRGWQLALHKWLQSDHDRALHDHSADNMSVLLWGTYREYFSHDWEPARWKLRIPFIPYFRRAEMPHRVKLHRGGPVWTLWLRWPPLAVRRDGRKDWGFWCQKGWRHFKDYIAESDYSKPGSTSSVGRGCD